MEKLEAKVSQRGFLGMLGAAIVGVSCAPVQIIADGPKHEGATGGPARVFAVSGELPG